MLNPVRSKQFKKDYKLAKSRGKCMKKLIDIMDKLLHRPNLEIREIYALFYKIFSRNFPLCH